MVKNKINLSLNEPYIRQVYAKEGDSGRVYEFDIDPTPTENGTLRIKRPDGVEVTSPASLGEDITESGEVVSFDALDEAPMSSLKVGIEPIQDLHGQSNPYPAGGGKNLFQNVASSTTSSDVTFTVNADGTVSLSGTASAFTYLTLNSNFTLPAGSYILSGCPSGGSYTTYSLRLGNIIVDEYGSGASFTLTEETTTKLMLLVRSGANVSGIVFKPMICLASAPNPTNFAPYSNICPIYANGSVNVWDEEWENGYWNHNNNGVFVSNANYVCCKNYIEVEPNTSYWYQTPTVAREVLFYDKSKNLLSYQSYGATAEARAFTTPNNCYYVTFYEGTAYGSTYNNDISINRNPYYQAYIPHGKQIVEITQSGKNLLNPTLHSGLLGLTVGSNDTSVTASTRYGYSDKVDAAKVMKMSYKSNDISKFNWIVVMRYVDGIATEVLVQTMLTTTSLEQLNIPAVENSYIRVQCGAPSGVNVGTQADGELQVEYGTTATDYVAYNGQTIPTTFPQLVYKGTLDVVQGKLTVTHASLTKNTSTMNNSEDFGGWRNSGVKALVGAGKNTAYSQQKVNIGTIYAVNTVGSNDILYLPKTYYGLTQTEWQTLAIDVQVLVKLETPTVIDLTPQQMSTLLGDNNIFADCGDVLEVKFAYDGMLSALPSQATEVVGRCIGDVELGGVSTMPFTLVVQKNNQGE